MDESLKTDLITMTRHVLAEQRLHPDATGDLTLILQSIQLACKFVAASVRKAGLANLTGLAGSKNVQNEEQKKLDIIAHEIFVNSLKSCGSVGFMVSEEEENPIFVDLPSNIKPKYAVVFDPLDGSSNIDAGVSVGSIFGIYRLQKGSRGDLNDVLKPGRDLRCAGYCIYGSSTIMTLAAMGSSVNCYSLDPTIGEFILTDPNLCIPNKGLTYSINEGNVNKWPLGCKKYVDTLKNPINKDEKSYSLRYIGSMVADVHRTIKYGGIFMYPSDNKSKNGKLRLLYECNPMSFIVEMAGGKSITDGKNNVLDIQPESIHQRTSIYLGSKNDIENLEKFL